MAEIDYTFLKQKAAGLDAKEVRPIPTSEGPLAPSGSPPDLPGMSERLARLEGAFDGFKTVLAIFAGVLALSVTITFGGFVYLSNRIDRVEAKVERVEAKVGAVSDQITALPDKVSGNLRDLTSAMSQAITASKQAPPQVILMPSPQPATSSTK